MFLNWQKCILFNELFGFILAIFSWNSSTMLYMYAEGILIYCSIRNLSILYSAGSHTSELISNLFPGILSIFPKILFSGPNNFLYIFLNEFLISAFYTDAYFFLNF